jgi:hypothetical protein
LQNGSGRDRCDQRSQDKSKLSKRLGLSPPAFALDLPIDTRRLMPREQAGKSRRD